MTRHRPPRFPCDEMLSGLGRWLRSAGYGVRRVKFRLSAWADN